MLEPQPEIASARRKPAISWTRAVTLRERLCGLLSVISRSPVPLMIDQPRIPPVRLLPQNDALFSEHPPTLMLLSQEHAGQLPPSLACSLSLAACQPCTESSTRTRCSRCPKSA